MCGYEPGSFTGADRLTHHGVFDTADGGTLFLDELQDAHHHLQSLLLRVLETGTFVRVGGRLPVKTDLRVVAASSIGLHQLRQHNTVRHDLLYRLACLIIEIPPLRERPDDLKPIANKL